MQADALIRQVQYNCDICNARHAGTYSVCGLLLRLRNLYKSQLGLPPWEEPDPRQALDWVSEQEKVWERLAGEEFRPLVFLGRVRIDPLDAEAVNARLRGSGLIYGAGFGWGLRPSFFLGRIEARRRVHGQTVRIVGRELARDLASTPAQLLGSRAVARAESAGYYLWDRIHDVRKSGQPALLYALRAHGIAAEDLGEGFFLRLAFPRMLKEEMESYIRHEIGEKLDDSFPRDVWRAIIARFPGERIEIVARALKDVAADTCDKGPLAYIIRKKRGGSLGFYVAFLDGARRLLLPNIASAFEAFTSSGDWAALDAARREAHQAAKESALKLIAIFSRLARDGEEKVKAAIAGRITDPLGL
ncbi:MAG: hypothetical protein V2A77_00170 [Pseudomonadota bacterium]